MSRILTVDVGKTGTRASLWQHGRRGPDVEVPSESGVAHAGGVDATLEAIRRAGAHTSDAPGEIATVSVGLAGMWSTPERAEALAHGLHTDFPRARSVITTDAVTSHAGALNGEAGTVLAAGTGVAALAIGPDGAVDLVDGWGYLLGDAGSGYWIGRAGLESALRAADGRGGSDVLLDRMRATLGEPRSVPGQLHSHSNPARLVASFAREVFAASEADDPRATAICDAAAHHLATSAVAAADRVASAPLAAIGGVFAAGAVITERLDSHLEALRPDLRRTPSRGDALDGAYLLAAHTDLPHHRIDITTTWDLDNV